ncbi:Sec63 Brl domain-containing protein [Lentinula raphanica]|uniref:Sec63 Brl domain-containing protein n=1 Tax=Lentinula raphanica TaxID=153919 RepID=A0AA38UIQ2_9AGAR|nr:Sec63 Brl domain-containing protein [Lentinula raphanica]KAJ3976171.1 Sec63 Brl domain-containing protein [Lentinula raphanica]
MANYSYDEGGNMAAYFIITFLALILIPLTLSISPSKKKGSEGCQCTLCSQQRLNISKREKGSIFNPQFSTKSLFIIGGWIVFAFFSYRVANAKLDNKVYDPFEILGISMSATEKEIKSHYKKLSKIYHPDKVKATVNETIEQIQNRFVDLTKAYKSLTDETIRENLRKYGNPDGPQQTSVGIALPKWIVESKNNVWVLGVYGLIFGGALPTLVGRWWFGSRQKTKDGIKASSAAAFFKALREDSTMDDVVAALGKAYKWESIKAKSKTGDAAELDRLEKNISLVVPKQWETLRQSFDAGKDTNQRKAMILLYAHFLRLNIEKPSLQQAQTQILLQTPLLLNALLNIAIARNWLTTTMHVMRLQSYLAQAIVPQVSPAKQDRLTQLPEITSKDSLKGDDLAEVVKELEASNDNRSDNVKKAVSRWGRLELVDAAYKVIGERIIVPSSIVYLTVKLRLSPPLPSSTVVTKKEESAEEVKRSIKLNDQKDEEFLMTRDDAEPMQGEGTWAHAPYWPENRKPGWWLVLADDKNSRVVVPPMKLTNVPFSNPDAGDRDYRTYKLQFQAPQNPGIYTWKIYLVSDTFIGEEVSKNMTLKIDDVSALNADEQPSEDEISDPDEDTLAGQMTAMRGGKVKKGVSRAEASDDDESTTDDGEESEDDSSSDSD